jgi:NADH dehydrogenase FAD-containing subunit
VKRVIIVGGGYAGTTLARALDAALDVVLIEPREAFVHNVAAIRALVEPGLVDRIILPYDRLLNRGKVVRDRVSAVEQGGVALASGETISGDYVVLATGSTYAQPFKPTTDVMADFRVASASAQAGVKAARSIAIVGAGAVGVELAGEIVSTLNDKVVTLVCSTPSLFPDFAPGLGKRLAADLEAMGVKLKMGVLAQRLAATDRPQAGPLRLDTGEIIDADLLIPAMGAQPATGVLAGVATARFDRIGRVEVDGWMRPAGLKGVFALGDMAANGDLMTIVASSRQAPWLAKTLKALASGKRVEDQPVYAPWPAPPILIPLGTRRGASVLPVTKSGLVVGPFLTGAIKGRSLFIPRYHKEFGI